MNFSLRKYCAKSLSAFKSSMHTDLKSVLLRAIFCNLLSLATNTEMEDFDKQGHFVTS